MRAGKARLWCWTGLRTLLASHRRDTASAGWCIQARPQAFVLAALLESGQTGPARAVFCRARCASTAAGWIAGTSKSLRDWPPPRRWLLLQSLLRSSGAVAARSGSPWKTAPVRLHVSTSENSRCWRWASPASWRHPLALAIGLSAARPASATSGSRRSLRLDGCAEYGTGRLAQPPGLKVAGKTGTRHRSGFHTARLVRRLDAGAAARDRPGGFLERARAAPTRPPSPARSSQVGASSRHARDLAAPQSGQLLREPGRIQLPLEGCVRRRCHRRCAAFNARGR